MKITADEARRRLTATSNLARLSVKSTSGSLDVLQADSQVNPQALPASSPSFIHNSLTIDHRIKGKSHRGPTIPEALRDVIGAVADRGATCTEVAEAFGVSRMSVSDARNGTSGGRPPTEERREKIESRRLNIQDTALIKLMKSLELITDDKMEDLSAKELSVVSSNLSRVASQMTEAQENKAPVNIVVYAPEMRDEAKYKIIDI